MNDKSAYWESVAAHHKASRLLYHVDAVVHLEGEADIPFWQALIHHTCVGKKVKFISYGKDEEGKKVSGKSHCLKYAPYINSLFFLCIDSDFDILLKKAPVCNNQYIAQTHTYSWENHYCHKETLQKVWAENDISNFSFEIFLRNLNPILHRALIVLLTGKQQNTVLFTLSQLCSAILQTPINKENLHNNGEKFIKDVTSAIQALTSTADVDEEALNTATQNFAELGMNTDNAYLYMRGHCIYDMVLHIGQFLSEASPIDFKQQVLAQTLSFDGYPEIKMVQKELKKILGSSS